MELAYVLLLMFAFVPGIMLLAASLIDRKNLAKKPGSEPIYPLNSYYWHCRAEERVISFLDDIKPSLEVRIVTSEPVDHEGQRYIMYKLEFSDRTGEMPTWYLCIPETEDYLNYGLEWEVRSRCTVSLR